MARTQAQRKLGRLGLQLCRMAHKEGCPKPRECPKGHKDCNSRQLGLATSIAWSAAIVVQEVVRGDRDLETAQRLITLLWIVVCRHKSKHLALWELLFKVKETLVAIRLI